MADSTNLAYTYKGNLDQLRAGVRRSCEKMSLRIDSDVPNPEGFVISAAQKTNWLSTNWPVKFSITAERVGEAFVLLIQGASTLGSLTQSANNSAKAQELFSLIKAYAPTM